MTLAAKAASVVRCDDMATTSIWRVKGWLGKVVIYVENPDKTENPAFYEKQEMTERQAHGLSDALCREYGLSVIENPRRGKSKQHGEWRAEQEGRPTWRGLIRAEIDEVIRQSMTEHQFFDNLRKRGYEVKEGKDISVRPPAGIFPAA